MKKLFYRIENDKNHRGHREMIMRAPGKNIKINKTLCSLWLLTYLFMAISAIVFADSYGPTTSILSPITNSTASKNTVKVLVQAWDADGLNATTPIEMQIDSSGWSSAGITDSDRTCVPASLNCKIYQYNWDVSSYANGTSHTIEIRTRDTLNQTNTKNVTITVKDAKTGDGNLLAKERSDQLCIDCHNVSSHSSQSTDTGYGNWAILCTDCHTAHNTKNIMIVKDNITTPNSGVKAVKLYNRTGDAPNSFVDSTPPDGVPNGVCQVCHTQTIGSGTARWRNTGNAESPSHYGSPGTQRCTNCHTHNEGFKTSCAGCHGNPPIDTNTLVSNPGSTGSTTAGAHYRHANTENISCSSCHYNSVGSGAKHNSGLNVTMGFYLFNGAYLGGTYDGQTTADYDNSESNTIVSSGGAKQCSNIYCHGSTMTPNGETDITPIWDDPSTAQCGSCHGATAGNPPVKGSHQKHAGNISTMQSSVTCNACHKDYTHVNNAIDWKFDTSDAKVSGATYKGASSGSETMGSFPKTYGSCTNLYCHSNANPPNETNEYKTITWGESVTMACDSCHKGRTTDTLTMSSGGHDRLVGKNWIRKYPCTYCHNATTDAAGNISDKSKHANGVKDVVMSSEWAIVWDKGAPAYNPETKTCSNVYCHSDGTTDPETVRPFGWTEGRTECNTCHGHPQGSCDGCHSDKTGWPAGDEWKESMPMFANEGPGTARANSHPRHLQTDFQCDVCHYSTIKNGTCTDCHVSGIPPGSMGEVAHIDAAYHVNRIKDVAFKEGGTYNADKTCSSTVCHAGGVDPQWGGSVNNTVICLTCHGTTSGDVDDFGAFNGARAKINTTEWATAGHGRSNVSGNYSSGNPPANFPGNPCWYCHDYYVLHKDDTNPFRLRKHAQFDNRFEKECVYCHMQGVDSECLGCHNSAESLAPQVSSQEVIDLHSGNIYTSGCRNASCHDTDAATHKTDAGFWTAELKADVKNQYIMMGVCLKCHEDDGNGTCTKCHTGPQYTLGFDPGTGFIKPQKARANSVHYGYKHFQQGTKKGGKFCWDCHDPHGDSNIFMIQKKVATETDGTFGKPIVTPMDKRAEVSFTKKVSGLDYAKTSAPYNGICNVCHTVGSQHYRNDYGDGHNAGRICTSCHEHRFSSSHASGQSCGTCHGYKPVPSHTGFGLPRDCTKCHAGLLGKRMDIMGQFGASSHHVQGTNISNKHCYQCHWESSELGLINIAYHEGYDYKQHTTTKDAKVDLVILGAQTRPTTYQISEPNATATTFLASNVGTANERTEVAKVTTHCLSCHSDQNNDYKPFEDCKTPGQYAWDRSSIAARYSNASTTPWGKYSSTTYTSAAKKDTVTKAFSAHGNATANQGGWSSTTGVDENIPNTRNGSYNVQCFDCHNSHGSKTSGTTSSYITFNGTKNGGNLKETQAGKGGYSNTYRAVGKTDGINPYNVGAAQCFDCHESGAAGTLTNSSPEYKTPWGYQDTFGATAPIMGYVDANRFGTGTPGYMQRYTYKAKSIVGGHLKASSALTNSATNAIDGLCTPCHDPHGVSATLGSDQAYAVPLLKDTWMTSPYKEDAALDGALSGNRGNQSIWPTPTPYVYTDQKTFGGSTRISENDTKFAGLCLKCHPKINLTDGTSNNGAWKSIDRVHESVKGWGDNEQHSFACSKCHVAHNSDLPKLMQTNCLNTDHRGRVASGGQPGSGGGPVKCAPKGYAGSFPKGKTSTWGSRDTYLVNCHPTGAWPDNSWNEKTTW